MFKSLFSMILLSFSINVYSATGYELFNAPGGVACSVCHGAINLNGGTTSPSPAFPSLSSSITSAKITGAYNSNGMPKYTLTAAQLQAIVTAVNTGTVGNVTATPTAVPTTTPKPTAVPTATPTAVPTATPTATATPKPTSTPTATPKPTTGYRGTLGEHDKSEAATDVFSIICPTNTIGMFSTLTPVMNEENEYNHTVAMQIAKGNSVSKLKQTKTSQIEVDLGVKSTKYNIIVSKLNSKEEGIVSYDIEPLCNTVKGQKYPKSTKLTQNQ